MTTEQSDNLRDDKGIQLEKVTVRLYKGDWAHLRELLPHGNPIKFLRGAVRRYINGLENARDTDVDINVVRRLFGRPLTTHGLRILSNQTRFNPRHLQHEARKQTSTVSHILFVRPQSRQQKSLALWNTVSRSGYWGITKGNLTPTERTHDGINHRRPKIGPSVP